MSLRRDTLWNLVGSATPLVAAAALIPFILSHLGNEKFGLLTLIWALIGYFSFFDMGVGRALTYEISKISRHEQAEISKTVKTGILITIITGIFAALALFMLSTIIVSNWLKISTVLQDDAILSFKIAALGIIPTTINSGLKGTLEGLSKFSISNINKLILGFASFTAPAFCIFLYGTQLWITTLALVLIRIVVVLATVINLNKYIFFKKSAINSHIIKKIFNYGIWITISGIIGPLMIYGDRFFVSSFVSTLELPNYAIPQEALQRLLIIPASLCGAIMPRLISQSKIDALFLYNNINKKVTFLMLVLCGLTSAIAPLAMSIWISDEFSQHSIHIVNILLIGIFFNSLATLPYTLIHAKGNPKITTIMHCIELIVYIFLLSILVEKFGLTGAAMAWTIRVFIDYILLKIYSRKYLKNEPN